MECSSSSSSRKSSNSSSKSEQSIARSSSELSIAIIMMKAENKGSVEERLDSALIPEDVSRLKHCTVSRMSKE